MEDGKKLEAQEVLHFTDTPEVQHFAMGKLTSDKNEYGDTWGQLVLEYLKTAYGAENPQSEMESLGVGYKVLRRESVTVFYDEAGNTLFDVENARLEKEHLSIPDSEPQSELGKAISSIEKQAFDQAVNNERKLKFAKESSSSVYIGVVGAVTKLQQELKKAKGRYLSTAIIEHLIERCRESESLAADVCQDHKTWNKCLAYVNDKARTALGNQNGHIDDPIVYEWAEDYFRKDDKAEEEAKAAKVTQSVVRPKKKKPVSRDANKKKQNAKPRSEKKSTKASEDAVTITKTSQAETKTKKSCKDIEGQLDLFSFMGM